VVLDGLPRAPVPRTADARSSQLALPGEPASVPAARRFVRQVLSEWDRPELDEAGSLLVSELVSNAVLHARTPVEVELFDGPEVLLVV
jgi:anti-sigma regulatory factor (Ser/Thr protein kinase)